MKTFFSTILFLCFATLAFATAGKKELQLSIKAAYGSYDQTTIYFDYGVSSTYIRPEDGPKQMQNIPGFPNLYSLSSDHVKCAINGYSDLSQSTIIGLGVQIDSNALYTLSLTEFLNFDSTTLVILEDRKLHIFKEMQVDFYTVRLTPADSTDRFFLHVTKPVQISSTVADCNNSHGAITVIADSTMQWTTVTLSDTNFHSQASYNLPGPQFTFNDLAQGVYHVAFDYNNYTAVKTVQVNGTYIEISITTPSESVFVGDAVSFYSSATNTTGYIWSFGDGTIIVGVANPTNVFYRPGVDTVSLLCTNGSGCSAVVQMVITVSDPTGVNDLTTGGIIITSPASKVIEINMNSVNLEGAELQVYNLAGQPVYAGRVTNKQMQVSLAGQPAGIYLVSIKSADKMFIFKVPVSN